MTDDAGEGQQTESEIFVLDAESRAERDNIHRLRGAIISEVNHFESQVDVILTSFLGIEAHGTGGERFRTWVLGRVSASEKLVMLRDVVRDLDLSDVKPLVDRLVWANELRNSIAHSHVGYVFPEDLETSAVGSFKYEAVRYSRRGLATLSVTAAELVEQAEHVKALRIHLALLQMAVLGRDGEHSAASILATAYDALAPVTVRLT